MKKNTMIHATLYILIAVVFIAVIMMVLVGENGLINKGIKEYKDTHVEEVNEKEQENVVVIDK